MVSNLDKKAIINMENTARYQERSKLNVAFSTADRDSAVFVFNVTKDNKPMLLSNENVTGHVALKHSDESFVKDTLHFTEPDINGRFEYYLPNDILKRQGTVTMQVFISEKGNSNVTVAERIVSFDIQESIVSQISAETKLQYIVEYDELQAIIANRITDIEDNMANAEDYVSQLEQAREKGLTDIEVAKADSVKVLNELADKRLEEINGKASEYSSKFDADKQYMDEKHESFKESVLNSEVVTQGESKEWQKHKLTNDNGNTGSSLDLAFNTSNMWTLNSGFFYTVNTPISEGQTAGFLTLISKANNMKTAYYTPYDSNQLFIKSLIMDEDSGWSEVALINPSDSFETVTGSQNKANVAESNAKVYAKDLIDSKRAVLFEGSASGVGTSIDLSDSLTNYNTIIVSGQFPGGRFNENHLLYNNDDIMINKTNLRDSDGNSPINYEMLIEITNQNTLKIKNEARNNLFQSNSGSISETHIKVERIEGWK